MHAVACVLRSGGVYTPEWVARLQRGVAAHMGPHRFVCLSDVDVPCERIPLRHDWPGWWSKIEVFRLPGPVLYLDLDSLVVGDLAPLFCEPFTMVRDFYGAARGWHNSSVMAWGGGMTGLYDAFRADPVAHMARTGDGRIGDQAWIEDHISPEVFPPNLVRSYKADCRDGAPEGAAVVCFHGKPKMHEAGGWVENAWI